MKILLLYDTPISRQALYPLSLTRPVCDLRQGILTIRQGWQSVSSLPVFALSENWLSDEMPDAETYYCIDASISMEASILEQFMSLPHGTTLEDELGMLGFVTNKKPVYNQPIVWPLDSKKVPAQPRLNYVWQLFQGNANKIREHFDLCTEGRQSSDISSTNTIIGPGGVFMEQGVTMEACVINTTEGPVYIGKNALVMEGTLIRGPVAICENAVVKMGTRLYPGTTIGPFCTAGGEIKNSILTAYSNKAHDGYLGDAVLGEWCNLGGGTSNSNVKNTAGEVAMWHQPSRSMVPASNKCGLIMGDYSRCAINSSINTGTTIGVSCNIFDGSFPPKHLPSFSWGNHERYAFEKACTDANNWKKMKGQHFSDKDRLILQHIWESEGM